MIKKTPKTLKLFKEKAKMSLYVSYNFLKCRPPPPKNKYILMKE